MEESQGDVSDPPQKNGFWKFLRKPKEDVS